MIGLILALALPVTADSVGPLNANTPLNRAAIAKLFPGLQVRTTRDGDEENPWPTVGVFRGKKQLLEIDGCYWIKPICMVRIFAGETVTSDGARMGQRHGVVNARLHFTHCRADKDQEYRVFCRSDRSPFIYVFENKTDARDLEAPMEKLASCPLIELLWITPAAGTNKG